MILFIVTPPPTGQMTGRRSRRSTPPIDRHAAASRLCSRRRSLAAPGQDEAPAFLRHAIKNPSFHGHHQLDTWPLQQTRLPKKQATRRRREAGHGCLKTAQATGIALSGFASVVCGDRFDPGGGLRHRNDPRAREPGRTDGRCHLLDLHPPNVPTRPTTDRWSPKAPATTRRQARLPAPRHRPPGRGG